MRAATTSSTNWGSTASGYRTIQMELQADCLAGNWAASLLRRDDLQAGDVGEFLTLLDDVADSPGVSPLNRNAHGNTELRQAAFLGGFRNPEDGCPVPPVPSAE